MAEFPGLVIDPKTIYYKEIILKKESSKKWIEYYAILCSNEMVFNRKDPKTGSIVHHDCAIIGISPKTTCDYGEKSCYRFPFWIRNNEGTYHFKCETKLQRYKWMCAVKLCASGKAPKPIPNFIPSRGTLKPAKNSKDSIKKTSSPKVIVHRNDSNTQRTRQSIKFEAKKDLNVDNEASPRDMDVKTKNISQSLIAKLHLFSMLADRDGESSDLKQKESNPLLLRETCGETFVTNASDNVKIIDLESEENVLNDNRTLTSQLKNERIPIENCPKRNLSAVERSVPKSFERVIFKVSVNRVNKTDHHLDLDRRPSIDNWIMEGKVAKSIVGDSEDTDHQYQDHHEDGNYHQLGKLNKHNNNHHDLMADEDCDEKKNSSHGIAIKANEKKLSCNLETIYNNCRPKTAKAIYSFDGDIEHFADTSNELCCKDDGINNSIKMENEIASNDSTQLPGYIKNANLGLRCKISKPGAAQRMLTQRNSKSLSWATLDRIKSPEDIVVRRERSAPTCRFSRYTNLPMAQFLDGHAVS